MAKTLDEIKEYRAKWWKMNRAKAKVYRQSWRKNNPERAKEIDRLRRKKYASRIRKYNREYTRKHNAWSRNNSKQWRLRNPEKMADNDVRYRLRIKSQSTGRLSRGLTKRLLEDQKGLCAICACELSKSGIHRDHIIPISKGGPHCDSNIQLTCPKCNLAKGAR